MADTIDIQLEHKERWWFRIARVLSILLIMVGAIKDTKRAAEWLARHGTKITVLRDKHG